MMVKLRKNVETIFLFMSQNLIFFLTEENKQCPQLNNV